jgi:hypothetical protein
MRATAGALVLLAATAALADPTPGKPTALPTEYIAHRFYVTPKLASGVRMRCYTDSGGGGAFVFEEKLAAFGMTPVKRAEGTTKFLTTPWPAFAPGAAIPPPLAPAWFMVVAHGEFPADADCFLGQSWFGGRTWTFDYPGKTLWWRAPGDLPRHDAAHEVALEFKKGDDGKPESWFARIHATVDGEELPLLFDTGAMVTLSPAAQKALGDGPAVRGGSFITTRTFDKWHKKHPEWRVLDGADEIGRGKLRMIEVPKVGVGGFSVGPAWFAERPDKNFDDFMSSFMSSHVEGALGGSALHYLRVTVDYARAVAVFEKP